MNSITKYNEFRLSDKILFELIEYMDDIRDITTYKVITITNK